MPNFGIAKTATPPLAVVAFSVPTSIGIPSMAGTVRMVKRAGRTFSTADPAAGASAAPPLKSTVTVAWCAFTSSPVRMGRRAEPFESTLAVRSVFPSSSNSSSREVTGAPLLVRRAFTIISWPIVADAGTSIATAVGAGAAALPGPGVTPMTMAPKSNGRPIGAARLANERRVIIGSAYRPRLTAPRS